MKKELAETNYLALATSDNTRKSYRSAIKQFTKHGYCLPCDDQTVAHYLTLRAGKLNPRSLSVHVTAISQWHRAKGIDDPTRSPLVSKTLLGIKRKHGKPKVKARALTLADIVKIAEHYRDKDQLSDLRSYALVIIGFFGAFRRNELTNLMVEHIVWEDEGVTITLPRSKTDQTGEGMQRSIPYGSPTLCPVNALNRWLKKAMIDKGPVFRRLSKHEVVCDSAITGHSMNKIIKDVVAEVGIGCPEDYSMHSLRRGLATSAAKHSADIMSIKKQGGWKTEATVYGYIDDGTRYENNAAATLLKFGENYVNDYTKQEPNCY
jgi:integrase